MFCQEGIRLTNKTIAIIYIIWFKRLNVHVNLENSRLQRVAEQDK